MCLGGGHESHSHLPSSQSQTAGTPGTEFIAMNDLLCASVQTDFGYTYSNCFGGIRIYSESSASATSYFSRMISNKRCIFSYNPFSPVSPILKDIFLSYSRKVIPLDRKGLEIIVYDRSLCYPSLSTSVHSLIMSDRRFDGNLIPGTYYIVYSYL